VDRIDDGDRIELEALRAISGNTIQMKFEHWTKRGLERIISGISAHVAFAPSRLRWLCHKISEGGGETLQRSAEYWGPRLRL